MIRRLIELLRDLRDTHLSQSQIISRELEAVCLGNKAKADRLKGIPSPQ